MAPSSVLMSMVFLIQAHGVVSQTDVACGNKEGQLACENQQSHLALLQHRVNVSVVSEGHVGPADAGNVVMSEGKRGPLGFSLLEEYKAEQQHRNSRAALLSTGSRLISGAAHRQQATQIGCIAPITEDGYRQVAAAKHDGEMASYIHRVLTHYHRTAKDQAALDGLIPFYSGTRATQSLEALLDDLANKTWVVTAPVGKRAPISEDGYKTVAAAKEDSEMKAFVHRLLASRGFRADDDSALTGLVPFHSGTRATQSMDALQADLWHRNWVVYKPGLQAPLTEEGYQAVVAAHSDESMSYFINRILAVSHTQALDQASVAGLAPYYSGTRAVQSFDALLADLGKRGWVVADPPGSGGLRDADGKLFVSQCAQ